MKIERKLIELLELHIEKVNDIERQNNESKCKVDLYNELLPFLKRETFSKDDRLYIAILLDTIYKNDMYSKFYESLLTKNYDETKYNIFIETIQKDYDEECIKQERLLDELKKGKTESYSCERVIRCIKSKCKISNKGYDFKDTKKIIKDFEGSILSGKDTVLLLNGLYYHNDKIETEHSTSDNFRQKVLEKITAIPNILNMGYIVYDEVEVSDNHRETLDKYISRLYKSLETNSIEHTIVQLEQYKMYDITDAEYDYIIIGLLNNCLKDLIILYQLLLDKDNHNRMSSILNISKEYYQIFNKYLKLNEYYDSFDLQEVPEISQEELEKETKDKKRLIYPTNMSKEARMIGDLSSVPEEYYQDVLDLITRFKEGKSTKKEIKPLKDGNYSELKDDQIRIIFKHVKDDIYVILGVFVKKDTNDRKSYRKMFQRNIPDISTPENLEKELVLARVTEDKLRELVRIKGKKSNR